MEYYTLKTSTDIKIIGFYPQAKGDTKPFEWIVPPFSQNYKIEIFLELEKYFDIIFNDKSILTDIIDRSSLRWGIVISEKMKNILDTLNLPPHRFYPISVILKNKKYSYFWLHSYDDIFEYIDMNKSKFEIIQYNNINTYLFTSEDFYKSKHYECMMDFSKTFKITEIFFKETFPNYDLFEFENRTLISEKNLNLLIDNNVTGYEATSYTVIKK